MCLAQIYTSCDSDRYEALDRGKNLQKAENTDHLHYTSDQPYTLNVAYYVPKGMHEVPDWHRRLSGVLINIRHFISVEYSRQMHRHDMLVGLKTAKTKDGELRVKIDLIRGSSGEGPTQIADRVESYYKKHSKEGTTKACLVILPSLATTVPSMVARSHGKYRVAIARVDNKDLDARKLDSPDPSIRLTASHNFRVTVHELCHLLGAVHSARPFGFEPDKPKLKPIMSTSGISLGRLLLQGAKPYPDYNFISAVNLDLMSNSPVFSAKEKPMPGYMPQYSVKIYGGPGGIAEYHPGESKETGKITVSGLFKNKPGNAAK